MWTFPNDSPFTTPLDVEGTFRAPGSIAAVLISVGLAYFYFNSLKQAILDITVLPKYLTSWRKCQLKSWNVQCSMSSKFGVSYESYAIVML